MRIIKFFCGVILCATLCGVAGAIELTGSTSVNVTSDTATQAKNKAFEDARNEIILRELGRYANAEELNGAIENSSDAELMNIISSSSVNNEKVSDTTYSANVSFVIDGDAARRWMEMYSVQNWLPASNVAMVPENTMAVRATLLQPMSDWASLNAVARQAGVDIATTVLNGNNISFNIPDKDVSKFSGALRASGWRVQQLSGLLKIWK